MGLGGTAKKLGTMLDIAEQTYNRLNDVREQLNSLRETVEGTEARFDDVEREQRRQRALLEAVAEEQGIDTDAVVASVESEADDSVPDESATESTSESPPSTPEASASDGNS